MFIKQNLNVFRFLDASFAMQVFLFFVIQLTTQPLYHYWQPLFFEINKEISGTTFGLIFMSYSLCSIFLNYIFSKLVSFKFFRSLNCVFSMLSVSIILYYITSIAETEVVAFFSFILLQEVLFPTLTCISAMLSKIIDSENRPVILKATSFLSRIGMLISLGYIQLFSFIDENSNASRMKVHNLYFQATLVLFVAVVGGMLIRYLSFSTKHLEVNLDDT